MKPLYSYALIAAFAAIGQASAVEATTTPVGYSSQALGLGFNLAGITLQTPTVAAGSIDLFDEGNDSNVIPDNQANFVPVAGKTYILEITSGDLKGTIQEVPAASISATSITTPSDLVNQPTGFKVKNGDTYKLRIAPTLGQVFGTTDTVLTKGPNANVADIVWIPSGPGTYNRYFFSSVLNQWRDAISGDATNVPVVYADGVFIEKKNSTPAALVVSGEVKTTPTTQAIVPGFNLIGTVNPTGSTLQNIGIEGQINKGAVANTSDIIWVATGPGTYGRYYYSSVLNSWRDAAAGAAPADLPLSSAIFLERKGVESKNIRFETPASYTSL